MSEPVSYIHISPDSALPALEVPRPFRAILVLETEVAEAWQWAVSTWLVSSGCLYAQAMGPACSSWDDSIDWAHLERFDFADIPPSQSVMTTWHDDETFSEVCWFAKHSSHPTESMKTTVLLHVAALAREAELLEAYAAA